jgi:peptidoglycan/LPS O-acetylase OafA/YrhL
MERRNPIEALTGLRFVAALGVVLYHFHLALPSPLDALVAEAWAGVGLFFVLSGFVLAYTYGESFGAGRGSWRAFAWNRAARVLPLHFVALAVMTPITLVLLAPLAFDARAVAGAFLANVLFVQAWLPPPLFAAWNAPSWSVGTELCFYALFPHAVPRLVRACPDAGSAVRLAWRMCVNGAWVFLATFGLWLAWAFVARDKAPWPVLVTYYAPHARVWEFLAGVALGVGFLRSPEGFLGVLSRDRRAREAALAATVAVLILLATGLGSIRLSGAWLAQINLYWLYTPLFVLLIGLLAAGPTTVGRLLAARSTVGLGEASYGLYLLHYAALWLLLLARGAEAFTVAPGGIPAQPLDSATLATLAGSVVASLLSYRFVESPARRWLRGRTIGPSRPTNLARWAEAPLH